MSEQELRLLFRRQSDGYLDTQRISIVRGMSEDRFMEVVRSLPKGPLASHPVATWRGWVIYSWEMGHTCCLFNKEPEKSDGLYNFDGAIEGISPYFLRACGIDIAFDMQGEAGQEFYYGGDRMGESVPVQIELTLPEPLLEQLGLL